jgi:phospholipid/cholesterol/gamma-HCH transport system permease protein
MTTSVPSTLYGRIPLTARRFAAAWNRVGRQIQFYAATLRSVGDSVTKYRIELLRLIAQMALGTGALLFIGGTVVIVGFLTMAGGALSAVQGYAELTNVGVDALTGFFTAYANVRLVAPTVVIVGMAATLGAGATAQLGAMRINEEIDALDAMGVRSVAYLASSRVVAGVIIAVPLYCVALLSAFTGTRVCIALYGQSSGVYNHYFTTFLYPADIAWSTLMVTFCAVVVMLVHTYYGYTATGGPAGVGEAVGRAVRASLIVSIVVLLFASLAIYGHTGNFHLAE